VSSEIDFEAVPGLPHGLPHGERVVWQGRPEWRSLTVQTFKLGWLAAYFGVFAAARLVVALRQGQGAAGLLGVLLVVLLASACLGALCLMGWLYARSSIYTITTRRIVMRTGVALPMTWNLPFTRLAAADLILRGEADGDIALQLKAPDRIAWLHLWPHVASFHVVRARPTLRALTEPARVSALLRDAVQSWSTTAGAPVAVTALEVKALQSRAASGSAAASGPFLTEVGSG
jgi:hypothetical protein